MAVSYLLKEDSGKILKEDGGGILLELPHFVLSASANITASGENTTVQLTAPSGKITTDFDAGRIQDDENPADSVNITADNYTEMEWSIEATADATDAATYDFRVTVAGTVLDTYSVTPQWTVGAGGAAGIRSDRLLVGHGQSTRD